MSSLAMPTYITAPLATQAYTPGSAGAAVLTIRRQKGPRPVVSPWSMLMPRADLADPKASPLKVGLIGHAGKYAPDSWDGKPLRVVNVVVLGRGPPARRGPATRPGAPPASI